jgi:hypothetical protein
MRRYFVLYRGILEGLAPLYSGTSKSLQSEINAQWGDAGKDAEQDKIFVIMPRKAQVISLMGFKSTPTYFTTTLQRPEGSG